MTDQLRIPKRIQSGSDINDNPILQGLLKAHRLRELKGFKPLLYYNAGDLRVKRGVVLFDKGVSLLSYFTGPRLFLFTSPSGDIDLAAKSLANGDLEITVEGFVHGFNKVTKATYIFNGLGKDFSALFATSLKGITKELCTYQFLCTKLKESIWTEAQELQCLKAPDLGSSINVYNSSVKASRLLSSEIELILNKLGMTLPTPSNLILTIKEEAANCISFMVASLDGIMLLSSDKNGVKARCFTWRAIHSFIYRPKHGKSHSALVVTGDRGFFALRWSDSSKSDDQCRELAAFISSLAKRFRQTPWI